MSVLSMFGRTSVVAAGLVACVWTADAQANLLEEVDKNLILGSVGKADNFKIDTSMPDYPALALLGQEDAAVVNIATPEDLGSHLFTLFDEDGDLKLGAALGGHPYWWFGRRQVSLRQYEGDEGVSNRWSHMQRVLARTNVSVGVVELTQGETAGDSTGFKTSIGFSTEVLDSADPRLLYSTRACIGNAYRDLSNRNLTKLLEKGNIAQIRAYNRLAEAYPSLGLMVADVSNGVDFGAVSATNAPKIIHSNNAQAQADFSVFLGQENAKVDTSDFFDEGYEKGLEACQKNAALFLQRKQSLRIGAAIAGRSDTGNAGDLEEDGLAVWLSYRHPFGNENVTDGTLSSWGAFAKYETDASEAVDMSDMMGMATSGEQDMMLAKYDGWRAGLNINRVKSDFVVSGALSYVEKDFKSDMLEDEDYLLATITASMKVRDGLWAEASFGWANDAQFDAQEFAGIRLKADWSRLGL